MKLKSISIYSVCGIIGLIITSCSGNNPDSGNPVLQSNNIRNYLIKAAQEITDSSLSDIQSLADWEKVKTDRYSEFIKMFNCLRVTDVYQLPALLAPANIVFVGTIPEAYKWSENILIKLGKKPLTRIDNL